MRGNRAGRLACVTKSERKNRLHRKNEVHSATLSSNQTLESLHKKREERDRSDGKTQGERIVCEGDEWFTALVLLLPRLRIFFARVRIQRIKGRQTRRRVRRRQIHQWAAWRRCTVGGRSCATHRWAEWREQVMRIHHRRWWRHRVRWQAKAGRH